MVAGVAAERLKFGQFVQTLLKLERMCAGMRVVHVPLTARG
jgi:hypothetical protein